MNFEVPGRLRARADMLRMMGEEYLRPMGLEADRSGEPVPPDHAFYYRWAELGLQARRARGGGEGDNQREGTRWSARAACLLAEEAAYWDRGVAVTLPGAGLGGPPVEKMGTPEQRERFLSIFDTRERPVWAAFAMTEPAAGSDVAAIRTRCRKQGDRWILNGDKAFCSNADRASWIVVWATLDRELGRAGHRAFVVDPETPGFAVARHERKMGLKAYASCSLTLEEVELPADRLLGGEAYYAERAGFKGAMKTFDATRPIIAVMAVGIGRAAWDAALGFVRDHYELGRPLPRYRRIREKLATIQRRLQAARLLCWKASWLADLERPNTVEASAAKAHAPVAALAAASLCMEIMADAGIRNDHLAEKLYRDVKAMDIVEGTGQIQRRVIARRILDYPFA